MRICYTVCQLLDVDAAQLNVVTDTQQVYIAEWPRVSRPPVALSNSGCREVVLANDMIAIEDTLAHPIMCQMPWTLSWRGYLGVPLHYDGQTIGSLCALTVKKRAWTSIERVSLEALAELSETLIELGLKV